MAKKSKASSQVPNIEPPSASLQQYKPASHWVPTNLLIPWVGNPRDNDESIEAVMHSIQQVGFGAPIVARFESHEIIAGHTRLKAAIKLGLSEVPVRFVDVDEHRAHMMAIADNRLGEFSKWNDKLLLEHLSTYDSSDLKTVGFSRMELDAMMHDVGSYQRLETNPLREDSEEESNPEEQESEAEEEQEIAQDQLPATTRTGDIWILGKHRLGCGDSTDSKTVEKVRGKLAKAKLLHTDPPYGVEYSEKPKALPTDERGKKNRRFKDYASQTMGVENDDLNGEKLFEFLKKFLEVAFENIEENAAIYVWHPQLDALCEFYKALNACNVVKHRQLVWMKNGFVITRSGQYHWQHELCIYGWRQGNQPPWYGSASHTTKIECKQEKDRIHPNQKPVGLFVTPIDLHTQREEVVFDPFAGSGAQFIAAEHMDRVCFGLDINPKHCDSIVKRWQTLTGEKAILESSGKTFEEVALERV